MEIASNFVLSVTPPSYQQGAEEARKDNLARVQIPSPKESQGSQAQGRMANEYGNTQGNNSLLSAQAQGILQAQSQANQSRQAINPDGRNNQKKGQEDKGQNDQSEDKKQENKGQLITREQMRQNFAAMVSQVSGANSQAETNKSDQLSLSSGAAEDNKPEETKQYKTKERISGARFSREIAERNGTFGTIARTIQRRYGTSSIEPGLGLNLDIIV